MHICECCGDGRGCGIHQKMTQIAIVIRASVRGQRQIAHHEWFRTMRARVCVLGRPLTERSLPYAHASCICNLLIRSARKLSFRTPKCLPDSRTNGHTHSHTYNCPRQRCDCVCALFTRAFFFWRSSAPRIFSTSPSSARSIVTPRVRVPHAISAVPHYQRVHIYNGIQHSSRTAFAFAGIRDRNRMRAPLEKGLSRARVAAGRGRELRDLKLSPQRRCPDDHKIAIACTPACVPVDKIMCTVYIN